MVLVMDTARFKFPPFWTKLSTMWQAIQNTAIGLNKEDSGSLEYFINSIDLKLIIIIGH